MADMRRPSRRGVDREHEHRAGRQQNAVPVQLRAHQAYALRAHGI